MRYLAAILLLLAYPAYGFRIHAAALSAEEETAWVPTNDTNCVAAWLMTSEGTETDVTGNGNDLTETGGDIPISYDVPSGYSGTSRDFELGDTEYLGCGTNDQSAALKALSTEMSLTAWVWMENMAGNNTVASQFESSGNNIKWRFYIEPDGDMTLRQSDDGITNSYEAHTAGLTVSNWHFVAFTWDGSEANDILWYVDGLYDGLDSSSIATMHPANAALEIGVQNENSLHFDGKIGEVGIWDRVLTAAEVNQICQYGLASNQNLQVFAENFDGTGSDHTWVKTYDTGSHLDDDSTNYYVTGDNSLFVDGQSASGTAHYWYLDAFGASSGIDDHWIRLYIRPDASDNCWVGFDDNAYGPGSRQNGSFQIGCATDDITYWRETVAASGIESSYKWVLCEAHYPSGDIYADDVLFQSIAEDTATTDLRYILFGDSNGTTDDGDVYFDSITVSTNGRVGPVWFTGMYDDSCVGYWRMDSGSSTDETDEVNGHVLEVDASGTPNADSAAGKWGSGSCRDFERSDGDWMTNSTASLAGASAFTVAFWSNAEDGRGSWFSPVNEETGGDVATRVFNFMIDASGYTWRLYASMDGSTSYHVDGALASTPGTWQHIAGTWDGSELALYTNGVLEGVTAMVGSALNDPSGSYITVGRNWNASYYWDGKIDDLAIFDRALTAAEIYQVMTYGGDHYRGQNDD